VEVNGVAVGVLPADPVLSDRVETGKGVAEGVSVRVPPVSIGDEAQALRTTIKILAKQAVRARGLEIAPSRRQPGDLPLSWGPNI
jgi:hypothetical protein